VLKLHWREIDRHSQLRPFLRLFAGRSEYPSADRNDEPGLFCKWDELGRRDIPALWMPPTQKRFDTRQFFALDRHQRLIVYFKLALDKSLAEIML